MCRYAIVYICIYFVSDRERDVISANCGLSVRLETLDLKASRLCLCLETA
jgi:hypothetical protein